MLILIDILKPFEIQNLFWKSIFFTNSCLSLLNLTVSKLWRIGVPCLWPDVSFSRSLVVLKNRTKNYYHLHKHFNRLLKENVFEIINYALIYVQFADQLSTALNFLVIIPILSNLDI